MTPAHIEDFYDTTAEVLCLLYAAFPIRHLVLVEDIRGPIQWDLTGLPDRKSQACFEAILWLAECELLDFRTIEPRNTGVEGAVLTQKGLVLLSGAVTWEEGDTLSRIEAMKQARRDGAYADLGPILQDLFRANLAWSATHESPPLKKSPGMTVAEDDVDAA